MNIQPQTTVEKDQQLEELQQEILWLKKLLQKEDTRLSHYLRPKNLSRKRTRFFVKYAKESNPRISALLFLLAYNTRSEYARGARYEKCHWHCTAQWLGEQLGVTKHAIYKIIGQAVHNKQLKFDKTPRGLRLWLANRRIYSELKRALHDLEHEHYLLGYYDLRLSRILGINGSILYQYLKKTAESGEDRTYTPVGLARCFPWMTEKSISYELAALWKCGYLARKKAEWHAEKGRIGWRYFWQSRRRRKICSDQHGSLELGQHFHPLLPDMQDQGNGALAARRSLLVRN